MSVVQRGESVTTPNSLWRHSASPEPPLRVGLLLESTLLEKCYSLVIEDLKSSNFVSLDLVVFKKTSGRLSANGTSHSGGVLYNWYLKLDRRMTPANDPLQKTDCSELLSNLQRVEAKTDDDDFPRDTIEEIRVKNLDVLIQLGSFPVTGEILKSSRYGVWAYQYGDSNFYRGGPPHFWEIYEGNSLSGVSLQVLAEKSEQDLVLCKSWFATHPTISAAVNRFAPFWGSTDFVVRKLNELHQYGWQHVRQNSVPTAKYQGQRVLYETPRNIDIARWLGPIFLKKALHYPFRQKMVPHWRIGIRINAKPLYESTTQLDLEGFHWVEAPKGHYWADPFGLEYEGKKWCFFEEYSALKFQPTANLPIAESA
jgi:hypothetical protein